MMHLKPTSSDFPFPFLNAEQSSHIEASTVGKMQESKPLTKRRERRRPQISCTECRRRKQKCSRKAGGEGPCTHCARRYPPVECYIQDIDDLEPVARRAKSGIGQGYQADASTSSEETPPRSPVYPAIPLHPVHEVVPLNIVPIEAVPSPRAIDSPSPGSESIIDEEQEKVEEVERQDLTFKDPWSKAAIRKLVSKSQTPKPFGGVLTMLNSFSEMPVSTTARNTELFHFFHNYVAPRLCSIDGSNIPPLFMSEILPWQIKSPLMPNVAILMASATQDHLYYSEKTRRSDTLAIKAHVLKLVNRFIQEDFHLVGDHAIRIVIHLVVIEFFWGTAESLWPHMEGVRQMINLAGGLEGIKDPVHRHILVVTDYELACAFERNLYFITTETALAAKLPIMSTYAEKFRCPLLDYPVMFKDSRKALGLSLAVAEILDDVRFLSVSIHNPLLCPDLEPVKTSKIQSTAAWLHKRLSAIPPPTITLDTPVADLIFDTILLTALVYTSSIKTLTPMSANFPTVLKERLYTNLQLVGLTKWNTIPGIFMWILLVAVPSSDGDHRGLFLRKQMACTGLALGLEDFFRGTAYLRAFWVVQRWIESEGLKAAESEIVVV